MAYIYNPAQSISQKFQEAQKGIGTIFSTIIAEREEDFKFAQDLEDNIEALKKNVSKYNKQEVYSMTDNILSDIGNVINEKGKIDYESLRDIKNRVSELKSYQNQSIDAENLFEQYNKIISADKGKIYQNTPRIFTDMLGVLKDKQSITDGTYKSKMDKIVKSGIDINAAIAEEFSPIAGDLNEGEKQFFNKQTVGEGKNSREVEIKSEFKYKLPRSFDIKQMNGQIVVEMPDEVKDAGIQYFSEGGPGYYLTQEYRSRRGGLVSMRDEDIIPMMIMEAYPKPVLKSIEDPMVKYQRQLNIERSLKSLNKPEPAGKPSKEGEPTITQDKLIVGYQTILDRINDIKEKGTASASLDLLAENFDAIGGREYGYNTKVNLDPKRDQIKVIYTPNETGAPGRKPIEKIYKLDAIELGPIFGKKTEDLILGKKYFEEFTSSTENQYDYTIPQD